MRGWGRVRRLGGRMRGGALVCAVWVGMGAGVAMARDAEPAVRIPLEPMGFQALQQEFLTAGSSMLTVDFVDQSHLLVTFGLRRLMKRVADAPPEDDDRTIGAYLVELPSGKVLARTEWRVHDRMQYLWSLGHGRFLLRVRDDLSVIAPLRGAGMEDAFAARPFLHMGRRIEAVLVSADGDLLTVETTRTGVFVDTEAKNPDPVQINFYRLTDTEGAGVMATSAGVIQTRVAVALPMTSAGLLNVLEGGRDQWMFDFDVHAGGVKELAEFDTSCVPHATFVGKGEFVAFGCRGSADKQDIAGFNLKGEAMWQQGFFETYTDPMFVFAPAAGRFALGRVLADGASPSLGNVAPGDGSAQEVRVYQSYNGTVLLRTQCSPVERAGGNFALSPDGMQLAVVQERMVRHPATKDDPAYTDKETDVAVYALPPLTAKDRAAVTEAEGMAPADTGARIDDALVRLVEGGPGGGGSGDASAAAAAAAAADLTPVPAGGAADAGQGAATAGGGEAAGSEGGGSSVGDAAPAAPRKAPTLYGPGEGPK